jgi:hypothetical protein
LLELDDDELLELDDDELLELDDELLEFEELLLDEPAGAVLPPQATRAARPTARPTLPIKLMSKVPINISRSLLSVFMPALNLRELSRKLRLIGCAIVWQGSTFKSAFVKVNCCGERLAASNLLNLWANAQNIER